MHSWKHIYGYLGTRMRRRVHARARCIIDAAAKFAGSASRNDRRAISGQQLKIDSLPASPLTQPGHIRSGSRGNGTTVKGGLSVNPSRHHRHWLRGRTPSFAIGVPCRSGKRRRAHELVSRHPNMLGICVGRNGLMIGIPKELLEKILALALRHCCKVSWTLDQRFGAGGLVGYVVVGWVSTSGQCVHTHTHNLRARDTLW